mgnify:CR=1 FL=1
MWQQEKGKRGNSVWKKSTPSKFQRELNANRLSILNLNRKYLRTHWFWGYSKKQGRVSEWVLCKLLGEKGGGKKGAHTALCKLYERKHRICGQPIREKLWGMYKRILARKGTNGILWSPHVAMICWEEVNKYFLIKPSPSPSPPPHTCSLPAKGLHFLPRNKSNDFPLRSIDKITWQVTNQHHLCIEFEHQLLTRLASELQLFLEKLNKTTL